MENKEKKQAIQEKEIWSTALQQAKGIQPKNDVKLLKKSLKRKQSEKEKSAKEWKGREKEKHDTMRKRQEKRQDNLQKRKDQKKGVAKKSKGSQGKNGKGLSKSKKN